MDRAERKAEKRAGKFMDSKRAEMEALEEIKKSVDGAVWKSNQEVSSLTKIIDDIIKKIETCSDYEAEQWIPRLEREERNREIRQANIAQMNICADALNGIFTLLQQMFDNYELTKSKYYEKVIDDFIDLKTIRDNLGDFKVLAQIITKIRDEFKKKCEQAMDAQEGITDTSGIRAVINKPLTSDGRSSRLEQIRAQQAAKSGLADMGFSTPKVAETQSETDTDKK